MHFSDHLDMQFTYLDKNNMQFISKLLISHHINKL